MIIDIPINYNVTVIDLTFLFCVFVFSFLIYLLDKKIRKQQNRISDLFITLSLQNITAKITPKGEEFVETAKKEGEGSKAVNNASKTLYNKTLLPSTIMGYCVKCKLTREMLKVNKNSIATRRGTKYFFKGKCAKCSTTISKLTSKKTFDEVK